MKQYHDLLNDILKKGTEKGDRTGTGTISIFGDQRRYDLRDGKLPVITTKKIHLKSVIHELLWLISGSTNIKYLNENGVRIWNEWADANGDLGPVYGKQWRNWDKFEPDAGGDDIEILNRGAGVDQLQDAIDMLRNNPDSRRIIVSAWNPVDVPSMKLPPCHMMFQFYSRPLSNMDRRILGAASGLIEGGVLKMIGPINDSELDEAEVPRRGLSCQMYQRSADAFLGVPFNITSYALLTHMVAAVTGHVAEEFIHTIGDAHIYLNHLDQVQQQLSRTPFETPHVNLNPLCEEIGDFKFVDIEVGDYQHHAAIAGKVAV